MMLGKPPALHDEGVSSFLAYEDDGHPLLRAIDVERIRFESSGRLPQDRSTGLPAEGSQIVDGRLLEQHAPVRHVPRLHRTRILVKLLVTTLMKTTQAQGELP